MLYKIDYETRSGNSGSKWENFAADKTEAVKRFMDNFFRTNPGDAVRIDLVTEVEIIGDLSGVDFIDDAVESRNGER